MLATCHALQLLVKLLPALVQKLSTTQPKTRAKVGELHSSWRGQWQAHGSGLRTPEQGIWQAFSASSLLVATAEHTWVIERKLWTSALS